MPFIRKHWRWMLASTLLVVLLTPGGLVLWAGSEIACPPRRALMDYHAGYLTNPGAHGIRIDSFIASDGTPCLVVSPSGAPAVRGTKIRKDLAERGIALPAFGAIKGTLVLTHGRKGRKEDYLAIAERFCACGFRCVIPDLPAHGEHPLEIATYGLHEASLPARILSESSRKFGFDPQPAGLMGMSMGGSVAVHAAANSDAPWKALVVVASFDSLPRVIEWQAKRHLGNSLGPLWSSGAAAVYEHKTGLPLSGIAPGKLAGSIRMPTLVAHGTADPVVPLASGRMLFDALPSDIPKQWIEIPSAGHDDVLVTEFPIYAELAVWMLRHVARL